MRKILFQYHYFTYYALKILNVCEHVKLDIIWQDVHNWCLQNIQNVSHISTNLCIHFICKIKGNMAAKIYMQIEYKSLSKCGILFVSILCTYCIPSSILIYKKCTSWELFRAYFRIQRKCPVCSKSAFYFGNMVDLILQPQKFKVLVATGLNRLSGLQTPL